MKALKYSLIVLLSCCWLSSYAQLTDTSNVFSVDTKEEVTYAEYLKLQEAYKQGKISKAKLEKAFNKLADKWDEICLPKSKTKKAKEVTANTKDKSMTTSSVNLKKLNKEDNDILIAANE